MRGRFLLLLGLILVILGIYITTPKKSVLRTGNYSVILVVDYGNRQDIYHVDFSGNRSLFDIMKERLNISYKNYSFGVFITCINNICQENDTYWMYYVDGKLAQVGASSCYVGNCLKNNSVVLWKYQEVNYYG